jgi:hypothetical protein
MKTNSKEALNNEWLFKKMIVERVIICALILINISSSLKAQIDSDSKPLLWFGVAGGANINFYQSSIQELNPDFIAPVIFTKGIGIGTYFAPLVEFHFSGSWGVIMQAGYDGRKGKFDEKIAPCGCPEDLSANISYITMEPSLRFVPFNSNFYLYAGPRLAFNLNKSFIYTRDIHNAFHDQDAHLSMKENFSNINKIIISMQVGVGYDIKVSSLRMQEQLMLSPFVSFQPYFGQSPRSIEVWNITTLRAGIIFKLSRTHTTSTPSKIVKSNRTLL